MQERFIVTPSNNTVGQYERGTLQSNLTSVEFGEWLYYY